jgi:hypothetical protein
MNHYLFVKPGERVFIMLDELAGDNDHTYVLEVKLPTTTFHDELRFDHEPPKVEGHEVLSLHDCINATTDGSDLLSAYQRNHEQRLEELKNGSEPVGLYRTAPDGSHDL